MDSFYPNITIFEMIIPTNIIYSEYFGGEKRDSNDCLEFVINNNWKIGGIYGVWRVTDTRQRTISPAIFPEMRNVCVVGKNVISNGNYRSDKSASGRINFVRLISLLPLWQGREPWREVSVGIFHPNFKLSVVYTTRMHAKTATCPALLFKNF